MGIEIELINIRKYFGKTLILKDISFFLSQKEGILGILGPNGAGKTTLIRILSTIFPPDKGEIKVNRFSLKEFGISNYRKILGYLPQDFKVYKFLTGSEFLEKIGFMRKMDKKKVKDRIDYLTNILNLGDFIKKEVQTYSQGMVQKLGIAQALLGSPKILILDEPFSSLDAEERIRFRNIILTLSKETLIVFSSHILSEIEDICSNVLILHNGFSLYYGKLHELLKSIEGKIYSFETKKEPIYEKMIYNYPVIKFKKIENLYKIRIYSETPLNQDRFKVEPPNFEDAYFYIFKKMKNGF